MKPADPAQSPDQPKPFDAPREMPPTDEPPLPIDPELHQSEDEVEEASDGSFPASDPPSYTRSSTTRD